MQRVKPEETLFIKFAESGPTIYILISIGNHKAAQHKKEIDKQVSVVKEAIVDYRRGGKSRHVKKDNKAGKYPPENIQRFEPFFHTLIVMWVC
jgi:hypothetical protein